MPNVIGITKDEKVRRDIEQYCREIGGDDLRFAGFSDVAEFEDLYFQSAPTENQSAPEKATAKEGENPEEGADLRLFSEVHLILVAEDALKGKPVDTALSFLTETKIHQMWPKDSRTRVVLLKFEEESFDKIPYIHPALDDLIFLPLDRLLFMQKVEILLNLPKVTKPSFLFYQQMDVPVEISKIVTLEKLNDCALAIRNKVPLKEGVRGKFYLTPPGAKNIIRFFGKVFKNEPHPDHPGEHLVYFFFFGMRKREVSQIRQWLSSDSRYQSQINDDAKQFAYNPDNMFLTAEEKQTYSVAIVDHDQNHSDNLTEFLERKMDRITVSSFSSFAQLYEMGLASDGAMEIIPNPSEASDLPPGGLKIVVDPETKNLKELSPALKEGAKLAGHAMETLFIEGQKTWWNVLEHRQNEVFFNDALSEAAETSKVLFVRNDRSEWLGFEVRFSKSENGLVLEFKPIDSTQLTEKTPKINRLNKLSAIIIDTAFVPQNFEAWLSALTERALQAGAIQRADELKLIFISSKEDRLEEEWLKVPNVVSFVLKPADPKTIAVVLAEALHNQNTIYTFSNLGWIHPLHRVHLSKPVHLSQIGEFGVTIDTSTPFKEGSFFFLRKGIFDEAPNSCLAARVYHTEPNASEEGRYVVHATYFGITDFFLKHARSYIREQYAQAKNKGGS